MKAISQDMTRGPLARQILRFSAPLMLSNVVQVLFNMSDIAVVGRFAGATALGAVGSTATLVTLFTGFMMGVGNGVNALTARCFGAHDEAGLRQTVHTALLLCLLLGLLFGAAGIALCRPLLVQLHTKPTLLPGAVLYLQIYFLGMPAVALYNFGSGVCNATGDTKRPLYILLGSGVLNVVLNLFFVIVCRMDVAGVALASILSQYLSAFLIVRMLFRTRAAQGLRWRHLRITGDKAAQLLRLGLPCGVQYAIFGLANLFIQMGVNSFDATTVSGNAAAANADSLVYDVMAAFYTACTSFIGQNYGAGNEARIRRTYRIVLCYSVGAGALLGGLLVLFSRPFLSIFTTEADVVAAGLPRLLIMSCSYAISAFMDGSVAAARGLGRSIVPTALVITGCCFLRIVWVYTIFAHFGTMLSLYLVFPVSWIVTGTAEVLYYRGCFARARQRLHAPM